MSAPVAAPGNSNPVLFISDLHLSVARPATTETLIRFLRSAEARDAAALYILGDLFDTWIGDDDTSTLNERVLAATAELSRAGTAVFFMPGNRDFLLGSDAAGRGGFKLLADPTVIDLWHVPTVLTHGDDLCTDDAPYQAYRQRIRSSWSRRALLTLPLTVRRGIARYARSRSERAKQSKAMAIMDVNERAVRDRFVQCGARRMIHGHTHRPGTHRHDIDGVGCERWVLADWPGTGSFLRATSAGLEVVPIR